MSNYPDDIRRYDDDPRSPFHHDEADNEEPRCHNCENYEDECDCEELVTQTAAEQCRLATGLTLAEAARRVGKSRRALYDWHRDSPERFMAALEEAKNHD